MRVAFVIFDGMTALDFVGVYDPVTRLRSMGILPDFSWSIRAWTETVTDDRGLRIVPDSVAESFEGFDVVIVPGGFSTRTLRHDTAFMEWFRGVEVVPLKASVCTGSLLLGAAGWLRDKPATTHPSAIDDLANDCREVRSERVVDAGDIITSGGVTAAIDLGLHLVRRFAGEAARLRIAEQMDYRNGITPEAPDRG